MTGIMRFAKDLVVQQVEGILDLVYPPACGICGHEADAADRLVCRSCWNLGEGPPEPFCLTCRRFLVGSLTCTCPPPPIVVFSVGPYDGPLKKILHDLKFAGLRPLAVTIGQKLAKRLQAGRAELGLDLIVPVPLHDSRLWKRGFNQAGEIAYGIGRVLNLPIEPDILYMTRKTHQQAKLAADEREANIRGAYGVNDPGGRLAGRAILVVDDITTTGATLREVIRVLTVAGAGRALAAVAAAA